MISKPQSNLSFIGATVFLVSKFVFGRVVCEFAFAHHGHDVGVVDVLRIWVLGNTLGFSKASKLPSSDHTILWDLENLILSNLLIFGDMEIKAAKVFWEINAVWECVVEPDVFVGL